MDVPDDLKKVRPARDAQELNSFRGQLTAKLEMVREQLEETGAADVAQLQERIFVQVFLPVFAGDEVNMYKAKISPHWINVAGNPYRPVDIVDVRGNVLFRVPPLLDRTRLRTSTQAGERAPRSSMSHVVASAQQYAAMSPVLGQRYLSAQFTERALLMKVPANVAQDIEIWNEIFKRYGRPPLVEMKESASSSGAKPGEKPADNGGVEIEFD
ncbi:hypothetical protein D3C71_79080 [compost metagenome]